MKKILVCSFLFLFLLHSFSAYAVEFQINEDSTDQDCIYLEGWASNQRVTVVIRDAETGKIVDVRVVNSDYTDGFSLSIVPPYNGGFKITAIADSETEADEAEIFYFSQNDILEIERILENGTEEELVRLFGTDDVLRYYEIDGEGVTDTSAIGKAFYDLRESGEETERMLLLKLAVSVAALKESETIVALDTMLHLLEETGVQFVQRPVELYDAMNDDCRQLTAEAIARKDIRFTDISDIFTEAVILSGIKGSGSWTSVGKYLAAAGCQAYDEASEAICNFVDGELVGRDFSNLTACIRYMESLVASKEETHSPRPGNSGGGGSSSGGGGWYSPPVSNNPVEPDIPAIDGVREESDAVVIKVVFEDVPESHWAFPYINDLNWRGIIHGYQNKFLPDDRLNRAEFVQMLCNAFSLDGGTTCDFADVKSEQWYYDAICTAYEKALVTGMDGYFYPEEPITRQDMAVLIYRFTKELDITLAETGMNFPDHLNIADYAAEAVSILGGNGIVNGNENGDFLPRNLATRAEAAKLVYAVVHLFE